MHPEDVVNIASIRRKQPIEEDRLHLVALHDFFAVFPRVAAASTFAKIVETGAERSIGFAFKVLFVVVFGEFVEISVGDTVLSLSVVGVILRVACVKSIVALHVGYTTAHERVSILSTSRQGNETIHANSR